MAKLTGNIKFTGSLGEFSAYKMNGVDEVILRRKGGATKEKIKKDPAFENLRRCQSEFTACAKAGKQVRMASNPLKHLAEPFLSGRLNAFMSELLKQDKISKWGERGILFSQNHQLLDGLELNRKQLFNSVLRHPVNARISRDACSANLQIPRIMPGVNFYNPTAFPMYRFIVTLGVLSDIVFDNSGYKPDHPAQYFNEVLTTEWHDANLPFEQQNMDIMLKYPGSLPTDSSLMLSLGIEFGYPTDVNSKSIFKNAGAAIILATG